MIDRKKLMALAGKEHYRRNKRRYYWVSRRSHLRKVKASQAEIDYVTAMIGSTPLAACPKCGKSFRTHVGRGKNKCDM